MDLLNLFKERYSVRKFSGKKIEEEKINQILEAGRLAPTAVNNQPQRIYVIKSEEALDKLKTVTPYTFNTQTAFLICYDNTISWKRPFDGMDFGYIDASIVTTQMMLEIANLGLGATWVGYFDAKVMSKTFNLPENIIPVALLPAGYPDAAPSPRHAERLAINETVKYI